MRCRSRNLASRRRWSLRLGLFLIYVLVQYVTSTKTSSSETTIFPSSSTQYDENWTTEPTGFLISSTQESESLTPASVGETKIQTERPRNEPKNAKEEKTRVRGLAKEITKGKEQIPKKETQQVPITKNDRDNIVTVSTNLFLFLLLPIVSGNSILSHSTQLNLKYFKETRLRIEIQLN